jgi:hypothetical protein
MIIDNGFLIIGRPVQANFDYTVTPTDTSIIIAAGGPITLTLPSAASFPGRIIDVKATTLTAVNSASANVVPLGLGGAGTAILTNAGGRWARLQSDDTNWVIMAAN